MTSAGRAPKPPSRGGSTRLAVASLILIVVIGALYLYYNPNVGQNQNTITFPSMSTSTSKSTTTSSSSTSSIPADEISIDKAVINNGTLRLKVDNKGPGTTSYLTVVNICTPKFAICYDYRAMAGSYYRITFVLPPKRTFLLNLTGVCTMPIPGCRSYFPVALFKYYLGVRFSFADGQKVDLRVTTLANSTWSRYPTAIMNVSSPRLNTFSANLSGVFGVSVILNGSLPSLCRTECVGVNTFLHGYLKPQGAYSGVLLSNSTIRCGGNSTVDCTIPLDITVKFSTVLTGISSGPYYAVVIHDTTDIERPAGMPDVDTGPTNFAVWVQGS